MKEEIRQILFELQFLADDNTQEKVVKVNNYINNLLLDIEQGMEINREHQEINAELRAENKRLKLYLDKLVTVIKEMSKMIK